MFTLAVLRNTFRPFNCFCIGSLAWRNEINGAEFQSLAIFGLRALPYVTMVFLNISKVYAGLEPVKKFC